MSLSPGNAALVEKIAPGRAEQSIARLYPELLGRLLDAAREEGRELERDAAAELLREADATAAELERRHAVAPSQTPAKPAR